MNIAKTQLLKTDLVCGQAVIMIIDIGFLIFLSTANKYHYWLRLV